MRKNKWKKNKVILPLLLSALMVVEPIGAATTVHAEEITPLTETISTEQDEELEKDSVEGTEDKGLEEGSKQDTDNQGDDEDAGNAAGENEGSDSDNTDENTESPDDSSETNKDKDQEPDKDDEDGTPEEELPDDETLEEESKDAEDTVSGNELEEEEEKSDDALNGFKGMPSSYKLSSEQMESKRSLAAHMGEIKGFTEGADYVKGQVVTHAGSQEEAEMIAEAYNAEIACFEFGVLTLQLDEDVSVAMAVKVASDTEANLPAVWPNYYRYLLVDESASGSSTVENRDGIEIETTEYDVDGSQASMDEASGTSYLAAVTDEYLNPESGYYQWHHTVIGSPYAWAQGYTGSNIKVAVLDSGVAANNDLTGVTDLGLKNSGNSDSEGHGTHVAGIIGARANGKLGVGVAPDVQLYSGNLGAIATADVQAGIIAAIEKKVDIINMSIGGLGYVGDEQTCVENAYNAGIAIFASASNDGGQTYSYPACYEHVISVAATDKNNERASFSNYSNMVDLSAPGVDIWSTGNAGGNAYVSMQGTSMACPVAAGEAAVILSGNKELRETQGSKRVDDLEKLMKKNAVKAGSGMGSGITSLTKVFGLSTATVKPVAPTIKITPDEVKDKNGKAASQKITVEIKAQVGTTIYYTTNGKNPAFKDGVADSKTETRKCSNPYTFEIDNTAKATIKAIAVNENGVSSAVRSASYTLKPYVTDIVISGPQRVAKGKNIQLKADVTPAYATNKKVTWELRKSDKSELTADEKKNLKIANGKVTATKDAVPGKYQVVATAQDDGKKESLPYEIEVINGVRVKAVKFLQDKSGTAALKNVPLELPTQNSYNLMKHLAPEALNEGDTFTATDFKWTSSNTTIASVNSLGEVTAYKAGKVTITALADDSSGKKATVTVNVTQLATSLSIEGPAKVARSKSAAFKAVVEPEWVTNKKVTWEIYAPNGDKIDAKENQAFAKSVGVSINAGNGKVTATKDAQFGIYTVKAITQDSAQVSSNVATIEVTEGIINKISFPNKADANVKMFRKTTGYTDQNKVTINAVIEGTKGADLGQYTVSNSNPGIAEWKDVSVTKEGKVSLEITATGNAAGKTKITIASTDGSNKKLTCNVTVVNPVSAVTIAPPAGTSGAVAQGKSLQLKAKVESENGAISNKNVMWALYTARYELKTGAKTPVIVREKLVDTQTETDRGIKIATNGKVTATKTAVAETEYEYRDNEGALHSTTVAMPYIVRATSKDGSDTYGEYTITVGECGTWIDVIAPSYDPINEEVYINWNAPGVNLSRKRALEEGYLYTYGIIGDIGQGGFSVSSSNPAVASVSYSGAYSNAGYLDVCAYKKGSATITIKAMDGSGKQVKLNVVVFTKEEYDKLF